MTLFIAFKNIVLIFIWNNERPSMAKEILRKINNCKHHDTLCQTCDKATAIKTAHYWGKN